MKLSTLLIAAALSALVTSAPARAQAGEYDRLKNILEDKFQPDTPPKPAEESAARSPSPHAQKKTDFEYVKPDPGASKRKRQGGSGGWYDNIKKKIWGGKSSSISAFASPAHAAPSSGAGTTG